MMISFIRLYMPLNSVASSIQYWGTIKMQDWEMMDQIYHGPKEMAGPSEKLSGTPSSTASRPVSPDHVIFPAVIFDPCAVFQSCIVNHSITPGYPPP